MQKLTAKGVEEWLPTNRSIWLLFNLFGQSHNYVSWYSSKEDAIECKNHDNSLKDRYLVSPPICFSRDKPEKFNEFHRNNIWLIFDLNNGHGQKHYVYWFESKLKALLYKVNHESNRFAAEISEPVEYFLIGK